MTPNFKQRGFLVAVNERRILSAKSMLESSFSVKQFDADVFPSSGSAPMNLAPNVNSGNFFNQQSRDSKRYQVSEVYSFSPPDLAGSHLMKLGGGLSYVTFNGSNTSNAVRILRADGTRSHQLDFEGTGLLRRNAKKFFSYLADKWSINRWLTLEYGVRYDRDNLAGENNFAPRIGFAFLPLLDGRTVVRGGIGVFYDDINLNIATFSQLQDRVLTSFGADGVQLTGLQRQRLILTGTRLRTPRSVNWNIEVDREWVKNLLSSVDLPGRWKGHRAELGVKFFNLTNHFNPRDFQNNLASDGFGGSSNGVGRKFGTRITLVKK